MNSDERHSITRSKRSALKLTDFLVGEAAGSFPGGSSLYKVSKVLFDHAKEFIKDRGEKRLKEFHRRIFSEEDRNSWEEIKDKEFSIDEYYSLLNCVVQDEEEQKVIFYAKLFRLLLAGKVPEKYRAHIIRSAREIKYSDLELLRQIYMNEKYECGAPGDRQKQIRKITEPHNSLDQYSIQTLIRFGYLSQKNGTKPPWPTDLLKLLVENLFEESELKF
ncbi:MAG: hypothetical protein HY313_04835 [Acidobacteria bacterium]|nr:hypothetical protein [Acidobacteriota bacterium]